MCRKASKSAVWAYIRIMEKIDMGLAVFSSCDELPWHGLRDLLSGLWGVLWYSLSGLWGVMILSCPLGRPGYRHTCPRR